MLSSGNVGGLSRRDRIEAGGILARTRPAGDPFWTIDNDTISQVIIRRLYQSQKKGSFVNDRITWRWLCGRLGGGDQDS